MPEAEEETFHGIVKADINFKSSVPKICHRCWGIDGAYLWGNRLGECCCNAAEKVLSWYVSARDLKNLGRVALSL